MKLQSKLTTYFVGIAAIMTIAGSVLFYWVGSNAVRKEVLNNLSSITDSRTSHVETLLVSHAQATDLVATSVAVGDGILSLLSGSPDERILSKAQGRLENFVETNGDFVNLLILNASDEVLMKANDFCIPPSFEIDPYPVLATVNVGHILPCEGQHLFVMPFVAPMRVPGLPNDLRVFAILNKEKLFAIVLDPTGLKGSGEAFLVNDEKEYMTPILGHEMNFFETETTDYAALHCLEEAESGLESTESISEVDTYRGMQGKNMLGGHTVVEPLGWCFIAEIPEAEALRDIRRFAFVAILAGFLIILANYFVISRVAWRLADRIANLQKDIRIIESGDLKHRSLISKNDEITELARAFNVMTERLEVSRRDVHRKVQEQTKDIREKEQFLSDSQRAIMNVLEDVQEEKIKIGFERDKIHTILFGIGDAVLVIDEHYRINLFNKVAEEVSGFSSDEVLGKSLFGVLRFVNEKDGSPTEQFARDAIERGIVSKMANHTVLVRKDGSRVPVSDSAAPLKNKEGKIIGCVIVFRDVTHEREIDKAKSEFVSVASHQLRTPLTSIKWFAEILGSDASRLTEEQKDAVQEIAQSNERMIHLVADLLNVSRIETGKKFEVKRAQADLVKIVDDVLKENIALAQKKQIQFRKCEGAPTEFLMSVDGEKISQVFQNLVSNAIKYSKEGGVVEIGCEHKANEIIIRVADHGIGIPLESQPKIFQKMFRATNASTADPDGNGLGLYIAKAIVEAHGGRIWFESSEGQGTTFYFSLPLGS